MTKPTDKRRRFDVASPVRQRQRPMPTSATSKQPSRESAMPRALPSPSAERSEYDVGYGKPPKHSQFKAGQSGNPKGRPKGSRSLFTLLREDLQRKVKLGENGKVTTVTRAEAVVRRVVADTLGGKASQTRLLFSLLETLEAQDAAVPEDRSLSKADAELIGNLLKGFADE